MDEPDAFKRQKEALFRYARYLKRVPTFSEAMQLLHDHHVYSGQWDENLAQRKARVKSILNFIARTFDPSKCAKGSVNVGKYDAWAKVKRCSLPAAPIMRLLLLAFWFFGLEPLLVTV